MDWLNEIWDWFLSLFGGGESKPIKIGDHVYMPLFYRNLTGGIDATWNYLKKSDAERKHLRDYIKAGTAAGETPAICFCLTPANVTGGLIDDKMLAVTDAMLAYLEAKCKELVKDGIAVFPCLYVDDSVPRWFSIESHTAIWSRIHGRIAKYVTGYILSIETNEYANSVTHIEGCINVMRAVMPDADYYGTHLQWAGGGRYSYTGGASRPKNANIILVEYVHDPNKGDAIGLSGLQKEYQSIRDKEALRLVHHEYNVNSSGQVYQQQKAFLRSQGVWGVAAGKDNEVEV